MSEPEYPRWLSGAFLTVETWGDHLTRVPEPTAIVERLCQEKEAAIEYLEEVGAAYAEPVPQPMDDWVRQIVLTRVQVFIDECETVGNRTVFRKPKKPATKAPWKQAVDDHPKWKKLNRKEVVRELELLGIDPPKDLDTISRYRASN